MKNIILIGLTALMSTTAFGAIIKSAKLDAEKKYIVAEVVYSGGCGKHHFSLKVDPVCLKSYPIQCGSKLVHETDDLCEAIISSTVVLPLAEYGLNDSYYDGATLTITGDTDWDTNAQSSVTLHLPRLKF